MALWLVMWLGWVFTCKNLLPVFLNQTKDFLSYMVSMCIMHSLYYSGVRMGVGFDCWHINQL